MSQELNLTIMNNGTIQMTSRELAEYFGKNHADVLRDIRNEAMCLENAGISNQSFMLWLTT